MLAIRFLAKLAAALLFFAACTLNPVLLAAGVILALPTFTVAHIAANYMIRKVTA